MLRYAISDRRLLPGSDAERRAALARQAARLSSQGVDYFQIREKDLDPAESLALAISLREAAAARGRSTRVVLNGDPGIAAAAGVGVHLPFPVWSATQVEDSVPRRVTSISCHSAEEVEAAAPFAEVLLFAPVFEKQVAGRHVVEGRGLQALSAACSRSGGVPVLALGGVTETNAAECLAVGASGIAGIRMFL